MKYPILEDIGKHFIDHAAALVKTGHKFVYVLDNIDWEEKAHDMRQDIQNKVSMLWQPALFLIVFLMMHCQILVPSKS